MKRENIGIVVVAIAAIAGAFVLTRPHAPVGPAASSVPAAAVTTVSDQAKSQPIPHGIQTYGVGEAKGIMPEIRQISVDAPDAAMGDAQKFVAVVSSDAAITSVVVTTKTDHKQTDTALALSDGKYVGSWTMNDSHEVNYFTTFTVTDAKGRKNTVTLTWRDPSIVDPLTGQCGQVDGTSYTLTNKTCIENGIDGINNANFTIGAAGILQLNSPAQFAWNPGFSIFLTSTSTGKTLIATGAALKKGFVCFDGTTYFITADSASCAAAGGTLRDVNPVRCTGFPRPQDCL